jgi:hypothetical protein
MTQSFKDYGSKMMSGDEEGAKKAGLEIEGKLKNVGVEGFKKAEEIFNSVSKLASVEFEKFKHAGNEPAKNTTTQTTSQQPQQQSGSWMSTLGSAFDKVSQGSAGSPQSNPPTSSNVNNLNNQTVNTTNNNQQTSMNQSNVLTDIMSQALPPQIVEHKFDGTITIKVDAPAGVDTAYVTKTVNDTVNKLFKDKEVMANNYGLTGGKVSEYRNSSGTDFG